MKSLKSQDGTSVVHALMVLVVLAIIGFVGYKVYQTQQDMDKKATESSATTQTSSDDVPVIKKAEDLQTAESALDKENPDDSLSDTNSIDTEIADF